MPTMKLNPNRKYVTSNGQIAGPFWTDTNGGNFFGKIGSGEMSVRGKYDKYGHYLSSSIERQKNPDIDSQFRIIAEYQQTSPES